MSTVVRCRTKASADVPFDRKAGTMSAYHNAMLYCGASRPDAVEQLSYGLLLSATATATDADLASTPRIATDRLGRARSSRRSKSTTVPDYAGPGEGFVVHGTAACHSNQRSTATNGAAASTQPLALGVRMRWPGQLLELHRWKTRARKL